MSKEPLDHVQRERLPWRDDEGLTECGLPAASYQTLTREAMKAKVADQGERRASLSSCMTCWQALDRAAYGYRKATPLTDVVEREIRRVRFAESERLEREFRALALLVEAHREEFDAILRDMGEAIDLNEARKHRPPKLEFRGLKL